MIFHFGILIVKVQFEQCPQPPPPLGIAQLLQSVSPHEHHKIPEQFTVVLHPPLFGGFCPETGTIPAKIIKPTVKKVSFTNIVNFFISLSPLN
jgi:hypothetical protein